jgi:hypothetical protein
MLGDSSEIQDVLVIQVQKSVSGAQEGVNSFFKYEHWLQRFISFTCWSNSYAWK